MKLARSVALALALASTALPRAAPAEEDPELAQIQIVRIQVDGDATAVARTRTVASELLERLGVASIVSSGPDTETEAAAGRQLLARVYFDLRDPSTPGIVVVDAQTEREVVRRVLPDSASLEISVEELTHVLYVVVESMLQTARARPPAPPQVVPPPPPIAKPPPQVAAVEPAARGDVDGPTLALGAFFRLLAIDSSSLLPGGGLALDARSRGAGVAYGAALMASLQASNQINFEGASGGVQPFSLRAYGTVSVPTEAGVSLVAGLGGGVDLLQIRSDSASPEVRTEEASQLDAILSSLLGARLPVAGALTLDAAFTLDLDLTPRRFVAEVDGQRAALLEVGRFRPAFVLGGSYSLSGPRSRQSAGGRP